MSDTFGTRIDSRDPAFAGAFDAREEGSIPARVDPAASPAVASAAKPHRAWLRVGLRIVRDAAIAVGFMAMVPIAIVAVRGGDIWHNGEIGQNTRFRVSLTERVRPFALAADPSITPMQAGLAFAATQRPPKYASVFHLREPAERPEATWRNTNVKPGSFGNRSNLDPGPLSKSILEAVAKGFTPDEAKFLRTLATAPIWREFDVVARAPAADFIGGRFTLPFPQNAAIYEMPIPSYGDTRELASAAVSRAAYHMSIGQRDSAETILRSIISFGFVLMDNGTTFIDNLMGSVIVSIGRDGLQRFYTITNDPRGAVPALAALKKEALDGRRSTRRRRLSISEVREKLIATAGNTSLHPGERYEALTALSVSRCTNVPELLFGRRRDIDDAIARARMDLARYPSERAMVELIERINLPNLHTGQLGMGERLLVSAGTVAGTVLRNPAMAACANPFGTP